MTAKQSRFLFILLRDAGIGDRHAWASKVLRRKVESFSTLTVDEAGRLINELAPPAEPIPYESEAF